MKNENGTPVTKLDPVEVLRAQVAQSLREKFTAIEIRPATARTLLRSLMAECDAKAAALDALVEAAGAIAAGVRNDYPNPMWDGASVFVPMPRVVALESALSAAKLAQAQS